MSDLNVSPCLESPEHLIPALQYLPGFGCHSYWRLLGAINGIDKLFTLPLDYLLQQFPGRTRKQFRELYQKREGSDCWQQYLAGIESLKLFNVSVITHLDARYPSLLSNIHSAPPVLYVRGAVELLSEEQVAFVGSRRPTPAGRRIAFEFSAELSRRGLVVTSGLATGIDGEAHKGTLSVGGPTIAVMGTGIDSVYPRRHQVLADQILATGGALVTEFLPGTPPLANHFPRRNRLISGMSLGVVVVEAAIKSGSLITAHYAVEQNREVFAVPGSINSEVSSGCHQLIKQGAAMVVVPDDILNGLCGWHCPSVAVPERQEEKAVPPELSDTEKGLWGHLDFEPASVDTLVNRSQMPVALVLSVLMELEIKGMVAQTGGGYQRLN